MALFTIRLDMYKGPSVSEPVYIRVGDKSTCEVRATITEDGIPKQLDGLKARFECYKPDGRVVISEPFEVSGSIIDYKMPEQVSVAEGRISMAYFSLVDGDGNIDTTQSFTIIVEPGASGGDISSSDYIGEIDAVLRLMEAQKRAYEQAEQGRVEAENGRVEAENGRVAAEQARVEAENARAANDSKWNDAEEARASAESERVKAEDARKAAETARATAEDARSDAEDARATAESARDTAEDARVSAENARKSNEDARKAAETARADAETARANAEDARATAETARATAEGDRASAETARAQAETSRATAETSRADAESARVEAENARKAAETARADAEAARASAEQARADAQDDRDARQDKNDADQAKNNADQAANNAAALGMTFVVLSEGQYDPTTLEPNVTGEAGKMYLVPDPKGGEDDVYAEWIWVASTSKWEHMGSTTTSFDPMTTGDIDKVAAGDSPSGDRTLNLTGLSYLWTKIKGAFAALSHTHTKSQITDFPESMPASDVKAWAKADAKPSYTPAEVGAAPASHTHAMGDVTGLTDALAGKQTRSVYKEVEITVQQLANDLETTVNVEGVTADSVVVCAPAPSSVLAAGEAMAYCSGQGNGTLTFACATAPSVALTFNIEIREA